ncbi:hypothetical protein HELRODRAFT_150157, partial [Helobdella robusta]|uniref:DH domain-containing protein n=1 Tax=Helobdella robusta TaxID=6412 RepID=T1EKE5_HELRO
RQTAFWHESLAKCDIDKMNKKQLDRQEAIFELFKSEVDLIEDLQMICNTYRESMRKLNLLNEDELTIIFGEIDSLLPIHRELAAKLVEQRLSDGRTEFVGDILLTWIPKLIIYVLYCTNLIHSKDLLDCKTKENESLRDFLNRCLNSPFSRKLDLWTFLDIPRSRLVKYPLMFKTIHKYTDTDHDDYNLLLESIDLVEEVIKDVDYNTGLARCKYIVDKLEYEDLKQVTELISESSFILCDGILKNRRGIKLHVFLFDKVMVLTRPVTAKNNVIKYRVYRKPVAMNKLFL